MHEGENTVHEGVNNMWRWEIMDYGEKYQAQERRSKNKVKGKNEGCRKCKGAT